MWVSKGDSNKKTNKKERTDQNKQINRQTKNKHFWINNISAKLSLVVTRLSGDLPMGVSRLFKQKTYKQTNNFRYQPNQFRSLQNFQEIVMWLSKDD